MVNNVRGFSTFQGLAQGIAQGANLGLRIRQQDIEKEERAERRKERAELLGLREREVEGVASRAERGLEIQEAQLDAQAAARGATQQFRQQQAKDTAAFRAKTLENQRLGTSVGALDFVERRVQRMTERLTDPTLTPTERQRTIDRIAKWRKVGDGIAAKPGGAGRRTPAEEEEVARRKAAGTAAGKPTSERVLARRTLNALRANRPKDIPKGFEGLTIQDIQRMLFTPESPIQGVLRESLRGQTPTPQTSTPTADAGLPPAKDFPGVTIQRDSDGKQFRSNGTQWEEVNG